MILNPIDKMAVKEAARICRILAEGVPRPALARIGQNFIVLGREEGVLYGRTDGMIYELWLSVDLEGKLDWIRVAPKPQQLEAVNKFLEVVQKDLEFRAW